MIYAKTLNPKRQFIWDDYMDYADRDIIIDGKNSGFKGWNDGILEDVRKCICECSDYEIDVYYDGSKVSFFSYYLKKANGKRFTGVECKRMYDVINAAGSNHLQWERLCICVMLSIIKGVRYSSRMIRGCCQSDWAIAYYPENEPAKEISYAESAYFGVGTEIEIHDDAIEPNDASQVNGYTIWSAGLSEEEIISDVCEHEGCKPDELRIWFYDHTDNHPIDVYR